MQDKSDELTKKFKSHLPPNIKLTSPFSKVLSLPSPMNAMDASETEVGSIFDSASKDWPMSPFSRCSSSDTSKESMFSPPVTGRPRSISSCGSGSRKSPRCSDLCSPASLASSSCSQPYPSPLPIVQEEREVVGCSSLSNKIIAMNIKEDETLPTFFNLTETRPRRGRSDSYCEQYDEPLGRGDALNLCPDTGSDSDTDTEERDTDSSTVEYLKSGDVSLKIPQASLSSSPPFLSSTEGVQATDNCSVTLFSPLASSSIPPGKGSRRARDPPLTGQRRGSGGRFPRTRSTRSETLPKAMIRATSLDFENSSTHMLTQPSLSYKKACRSISVGFQGTRHTSVDPKLSKSFTMPPSSKTAAPKTPSSDPEAVECFSQADEYHASNNPRPAACTSSGAGPALFNTPSGACSFSISGLNGNDWGVSDPSLDFELELFDNFYKLEVEGPRVAATCSQTRGIFSSKASAFGQKSTVLPS